MGNELAQAERGLTIVLDDYHLAEIREVGEGLAMLAHLPPQVHVIVCRELQPPRSCLDTARFTSAGAAQSANDQLVDAELLFGGFHRKSPV